MDNGKFDSGKYKEPPTDNVPTRRLYEGGIKSWWSYQNVIIVALLLIIACLAAHYAWRTYEWKGERQAYVLNDSMMQEQISSTRDAAGREINRYKLRTISAQALATSKSKEVEQLRKDLKQAGSDLSRLQSYVKVNSTTRDSVKIRVRDTSSLAGCDDTTQKQMEFSHSDEWTKIDGVSYVRLLAGCKGIARDSLHINYEIRNSQTEAHYWTGGLFKRKSLNLMITQDNPKTTTGKVQTYTIKESKKWYEKWWVHGLVGVGLGAAGVIAISK